SSLPATQILPAVGRSSLVSRRRKVDLPEPDWPTTKTNSPLPISTDTSSSASTSFPYDLLTWSSLITIADPSVRLRGSRPAFLVARAIVLGTTGRRNRLGSRPGRRTHLE